MESSETLGCGQMSKINDLNEGPTLVMAVSVFFLNKYLPTYIVLIIYSFKIKTYLAFQSVPEAFIVLFSVLQTSSFL